MTLFLKNSCQVRKRLVQAGAVFAVIAAVALVPGCGSTYRPVVTPIGNSGPPPQPTAYVAVVSAPSPTTPGIATIVDYSGDSVLAYASIGPGPSLLTVSQNGLSGFTVNSDGTLSTFPVSPSLQTKQVTFSTLNSPSQSGPPHPPVNMYSTPSGLWTSDIIGSYVDIFTASGGVQAFDLAIPVAPTPALSAGLPANGERNYSISLNSTAATNIIPFDVTCNNPSNFPTFISNGENGEADGIETASLTISSRIPVGVCPVYAVQSSDNRRLFVLNRGGDATNPGGSISVINTINNTADSCTPFQNQDGNWITCHPSIALPAGPVYAEYITASQQLVVANYDSNTISIINVSLDDYGNDSNTYESNACTTLAEFESTPACNTITGGFGTVYTVPVGNNPASVTVLADGSRAYTANQTDGTVTIVNIASQTVEKTIPVIGHPRTVVSIQNSQYGKVYVASPDSPYLTILRTDLDIVDTTILVEGNIVDVRVSTQNALSGNTNVISRSPGAGQPCNLPPALMVSTYGSGYTLADCQKQP